MKSTESLLRGGMLFKTQSPTDNMKGMRPVISGFLEVRAAGAYRTSARLIIGTSLASIHGASVFMRNCEMVFLAPIFLRTV